jgi:Mg/Co/Ni transporter MgtE
MMQNSKALVAVILIIFLFTITNQLFERTLASQMMISNQSNRSAVDEDTKLGTQDLNNDEEYTVTQEMIANDLHDLSPEEIATYPLNELAPADLIMVFNSLSVDDLEKTLNNISPDNLREILAVKLPQADVDQILNRLPEHTIQGILDRINPS